MQHTIEQGVAIFTPAGNMTFDHTKEFKKYVISIMEEHNIRAILFNFKEVNLLDSSGIGVIISIFRKMKESDGHFILTNLSDTIHEILQLARLHEILPIYETQEEGLKLIHPNSLSS